MANEERPCPCDIGDQFEYGGLGHEVQIEHFKAYICRPLSATDRAVIVVQDIFGWDLPNTRFIVDLIAANGYIAICPDFFVGQEPWTPSGDRAIFNKWLETRQPRQTDKYLHHINLIWPFSSCDYFGPMVPFGRTRVTWLVPGTDQLQMREANATLRYLKEQYIAKRFAVVGFCWGGIVAHHLMLTHPEIKAGVSVYGIIRDSDDRCALKNPTLFIFGENDHVIPLEQVALLEEKLNEQCKFDYEVKVYPGQTHGFVHRRKEDINPDDKSYIEDARRRMIEWLNKYM